MTNKEIMELVNGEFSKFIGGLDEILLAQGVDDGKMLGVYQYLGHLLNTKYSEEVDTVMDNHNGSAGMVLFDATETYSDLVKLNTQHNR